MGAPENRRKLLIGVIYKRELELKEKLASIYLPQRNKKNINSYCIS